MKILRFALLMILLVNVGLFCGSCPENSTDSSNGSTNNTDNGGSSSSGESGNDQGSSSNAIIADHYAAAAYDQIPDSYLDQAKGQFRIFYGHTSHGSQILTGVDMLGGLDGLSIDEGYGDLGYDGDLAWEQTTRDELNQPGSDVNVVMWSWCGGVQSNTVEGINTYLNAMNQLEQDYPGVKFVYMTGHLSTNPAQYQNLLDRNQQIRDYCIANEKILFDFQDVESYDPDGIAHLEETDTDACQWCYDWCSTHTCPTCSSCAHSHCFNCYLKGKAFWWMMARMAGWDGQ